MAFTSPSSPIEFGFLKDEHKWKILIVDDDEAIHEMIRTNMESVSFENQSIDFLSAYSAAEACAIAKQHPNLALILLDVIMESPRSGLHVIHYIRKNLRNEFIRIVLLTALIQGEEEQQILTDYDINDFRDKTDLTSKNLFVLIYSSLRAYMGLRRMREAEYLAKEHQNKLLQADKMIALGNLVTGVAHEVGNPNNVIILNTPIVKRIWQDVKPLLDAYYQKHGDFDMGGLGYSTMKNKMPQLLEGIEHGAKRIKNIISDLKDFAKNHIVKMEEDVDLNKVVDVCIKLLKSIIYRSTKKFHLKKGDSLPLFKGNKNRIEQVLINLIMNACQALRTPEEDLSIETIFDSAHSVVRLSVIDTGIGIKEEHLPHITDPFFTTKHDQKGIGLGLSVSQSIIEEHSGKLFFESGCKRGTRAIMEIPIPGGKLDEK